MQLHEEYNAGRVLKSKRLLELHFRLSTRDEFEKLAQAAGFMFLEFYVDYEYSEFEDDSPFMICGMENVG